MPISESILLIDFDTFMLVLLLIITFLVFISLGYSYYSSAVVVLSGEMRRL